MRKYLLASAAAMVLAAGSAPMVLAQPMLGGATAEALSDKDLAAQKREFKHLKEKQKKLVKRQRAKSKEHVKRTPQVE